MAIAAPLRVMAAPETKPTPVAVSVKAGLPAATAAGEMEVRLNVPPGEFPVMVRVSASEVVLSAFMTRMLTAPADAICAAETFAVSWVADETVVANATPSHRTVVPPAKLVPVASSVNASLPAATVVGFIDDNVGVRMPLNPPQPFRTKGRTASNRRTRK